MDAAAALLDDPGVDALLVSPIPVTPALDNLAPDLVGSALGEHLRRRARSPRSCCGSSGRRRSRVVVSVDSGRLYDDFVAVLQRGGIPVYRKIDRASRALSALCS